MQLVFHNVEGSGQIQLDVLKAICGDTKNKSMIDIGCGYALTTRKLGFYDKFFIDIVKRKMGNERRNFLQRDILSFIDNMFSIMVDVTLSLDNIEHFWEDDGKRIIKWMEENSKKQILFTPLGRYMNVSDETNTDPDTHKFSWMPEMLPDYAHIIFPKFHPTLGEGGLGAFFSFKCKNIQEEFIRIYDELHTHHWALSASMYTDIPFNKTKTP